MHDALKHDQAAVLALIGLVLGLGACDAFKIRFADDTGDSASSSDDSGDTSGSEGGSGDEGGSGTVVDDAMDLDVACDAVQSEDQGGPDCVTREIACGETVQGTTDSGEKNMDGGEYVKWFCTPTNASHYTGSERVYEFEHPGTGIVTFTFDSPCADLDIFVLNWASSTCPSEDNAILECESVTSWRKNSIQVWNNEPARYLVVVDGDSGEEGNFAINVECE